MVAVKDSSSAGRCACADFNAKLIGQLCRIYEGAAVPLGETAAAIAAGKSEDEIIAACAVERKRKAKPIKEEIITPVMKHKLYRRIAFLLPCVDKKSKRTAGRSVPSGNLFAARGKRVQHYHALHKENDKTTHFCCHFTCNPV